MPCDNTSASKIETELHQSTPVIQEDKITKARIVSVTPYPRKRALL
jgi:hypothetical protein